MPEIKAGPELDKAVAEAIGAKFIGDGLEGLRYGPVYKLGNERFSLFSEDLNAAFAAAENVWLFHGAWLTQNNNTDKYEVCFDDSHCVPSETEFVSAATPALAICAAILELAKVSA